MAENFTTYSEEDPNSRITKTATRVTWTNLDRNETAYVYKDKGVAYFDADFTHLLTFRMTAHTEGAYVNIWALTNVLNSLNTIRIANGDWLGINVDGGTGSSIGLAECDGGTVNPDTWTEIELNTNYYLKIVRDESVGTYGTLYCYIYSDSARTTLLHTLTVTLLSKKDFRYVHAVNSDNRNLTPYPESGYTENLDITVSGGAYTSPSVTTQACTDIAPESLTGNGVITDLGTSTVTQHGHCWSTSQNPTTASPTKTEKGIAYQTGHFTSAITELTAGATYYFKAYAINSEGTAYGSQVSNTMATSIGRRHWWVEGRDFHWFGQDGVEYIAPGIGVASPDIPWPF